MLSHSTNFRSKKNSHLRHSDRRANGNESKSSLLVKEILVENISVDSMDDLSYRIIITIWIT